MTNIQFVRTLRDVSGTAYLAIPKEILQNVGILRGDALLITTKEGSIRVWKQRPPIEE